MPEKSRLEVFLPVQYNSWNISTNDGDSWRPLNWKRIQCGPVNESWLFYILIHFIPLWICNLTSFSSIYGYHKIIQSMISKVDSYLRNHESTCSWNSSLLEIITSAHPLRPTWDSNLLVHGSRLSSGAVDVQEWNKDLLLPRHPNGEFGGDSARWVVQKILKSSATNSERCFVCPVAGDRNKGDRRLRENCCPSRE